MKLEPKMYSAKDETKRPLFGDSDGLPPLRSQAQLVTPYSVGVLGLFTVLLVVGIALGLWLIPWRQSVVGQGRVFVFDPEDRPQEIDAQLSGRLVRWRVQEGEVVKRGQVIAELADIDSKFLDERQLQKLLGQRRAQQAKIDASLTRATALERQLKDLEGSRSVAVPAAGQRAQQARDRERQANQALLAAGQQLVTAELNFKRIKELHSKGLRSKRDLELSELDLVRARTERERAEAAAAAARRDVQVLDFDQEKVGFDTSASLNSLRASLASVRESIATAQSDLFKLDVEIENLRGRIAQRQVIAPRDGRVVRLLTIGSGATVKAGDILATIAPLTSDQAVELYISGNDAPLAAVGCPVRLQFAGWPALQFSGWPSVAVGTFGGRVEVIDAIDDGSGRYRVVVVPSSGKDAVTPPQECPFLDARTTRALATREGKDQPWPPGPSQVTPGSDQQVLRPGAQVSGWLILREVPLGVELWRQINAFPPSVRDSKSYQGDKEVKGAVYKADDDKKISDPIKRKSK
jgi:multidrug efflux pump subunit AcrA (membrane-fusion protein)